MAPTFFLSWVTWEKMTFVLGASICVVLVSAFGVRSSKKKRILKLQKQADEAIAERGEMQQPVRTSEEIPFGVRAIEQGYEVDGVWNSKTTTPLHSPICGSRNSSPARSITRLQKSKRGSSVSSISVLDMPEPAHTKNKLPSTAPKSEKPDRGPELTRRPLYNSIQLQSESSGQSQSESLQVPRPGSRGPSHTIHYMQPNILSDRTNVLAERRNLPQLTIEVPSQRVSNQPSTPQMIKRQVRSHRIVIGGVHDAAYPKPDPTPPFSDEIDGLESMQAHRKFHAAEIGQLVPRTRRLSNGDFAAGLTPTASESDSDYSSARAVSWPLRGVVITRCGSRSKSSDASSDSKAVPFRAFVQDHPPPANAPPSAWTGRMQELVDEKLEGLQSIGTAHPVLHRTLPTAGSVPHPPTAGRKVNEYFEILPAGTFDKPVPVKEFGLWPETSESSKDEPSKPRKLQKRDRSVLHGRASPSSSRASSEVRRGSPGKEELFVPFGGPGRWPS